MWRERQYSIIPSTEKEIVWNSACDKYKDIISPKLPTAEQCTTLRIIVTTAKGQQQHAPQPLAPASPTQPPAEATPGQQKM